MNVCHGDLKLENTLLDGCPAPRVKICDFEFSKSLVLHSGPNATVRTPAYIAPEVLSGKEYDGKVGIDPLPFSYFRNIPRCISILHKQSVLCAVSFSCCICLVLRSYSLCYVSGSIPFRRSRRPQKLQVIDSAYNERAIYDSRFCTRVARV